MHEMFRSLGIGLCISVFVILVMLTAYFESPRLALASIGAVPGVMSGIVLALYLTGTTLNGAKNESHRPGECRQRSSEGPKTERRPSTSGRLGRCAS
jgi:hypothetical protein